MRSSIPAQGSTKIESTAEFEHSVVESVNTYEITFHPKTAESGKKLFPETPLPMNSPFAGDSPSSTFVPAATQTESYDKLSETNGIVFTVTCIESDEMHPFIPVTVTEYKPVESAIRSAFVVDPCAGIEELTDNSYYSLYPNPFNSSITIENYRDKGKIKVELMTVDARLIRSWNFNGQEKYLLPMSDVAAGVYFIEIKSDDHTGFFRIVKQ